MKNRKTVVAIVCLMVICGLCLCFFGENSETDMKLTFQHMDQDGNVISPPTTFTVPNTEPDFTYEAPEIEGYCVPHPSQIAPMYPDSPIPAPSELLSTL